MKKHFFSIPSFVELTTEKGWDILDENKTSFFIMRSHFMMKTRAVEDFQRHGEILLGIVSPENVKTEKLISLETEKEYINFEETFKQITIENQEIQEIANEIRTNLGIEYIGGIDSVTKANIKEVLTQSYVNGIKNCQTVRYLETRKHELKNVFSEDLTEKVYYVKAYQKYAFDIYLTYIDYLFVDYKKSYFGLRKKRKKSPRIIHPKSHSNVIKFNTPLATMHFWKYSPESNCIVKESEYVNGVPRPDEFNILLPEDLHAYHAIFPKIPTLYQLSNVAFPFKWIDRKDEWTKEELMDIENSDYDDFWFFNKDKLQKNNKKTANNNQA